MDNVTENYDDIFVTEKDTFDVAVKYYKDGKNILVEGVDDNFSKDKKAKQFTMTIKYPSQADVAMIYRQGVTLKASSAENVDIRDILGLEVARLLCLMRKWTISDKLELTTVMNMHPKIIKAIISKVREILGMDGII